MSGTLVLCSSPIGNLGDVSDRLGEVLRSVDVVYAEDTRRTKVLLEHVAADVAVRSYFAGNEESRAEELGARLAAGETVALVTDAGTPAISDPGFSAVRAARSVGAMVTVVPGPSAVTAALAVSGLPSERFVFEGFLPRKGQKRKDRLSALASEERTMVLFSAPGRLGTDLADLDRSLGSGRELVVARELTKLHEEVWSGTISEARARFSNPRGEFTLVVAGGDQAEVDLEKAAAMVQELRADGLSMNDAVRQVAGLLGARRNDVYRASLDDVGG